jgi:two-component system, chemotaxis family, sensor kinase CheA
MTDRFRETFREEALEILAELESALLELEEQPDDQAAIGRVFRALHTIKGAGGLAGFDDVAEFTHEIETAFELVRQGRVAVTRDLVSLTLAARDQIRALIDAAFGGEPAQQAETARIVLGLREILPLLPSVEYLAPPQSPCLEQGGTYRIRFAPSTDIFSKGINPLSLLRELQLLGDCRVVAQVDRVPLLDEMDPEQCYLYWDVILSTNKGINAVRDVFIFVEDDSSLEIIRIDDGIEGDSIHLLLGEILVERGDLPAESLAEVLKEKERFGEVLIRKKLIDGSKIEAALIEQQRIRELRQERRIIEEFSSVRVRSEKLDSLVNLIGELVTVQARLSQTSLEHIDTDLAAIAEEVERLTWALRDEVLTIRMIPIGTTFSKFKRLVRDLGDELGKGVDLTTEGAETELDKTVIERLNDPLVHLIRNCIDHGIEVPANRRLAGKRERGSIHLAARHSGAHVIISVSDDGAGIDRDAVCARAIAMGLINSGAELPDRELLALLFTSGLSTAEAVTSISGRGVGMDVVRQAIENLRGSIEVSSRTGEGTTFNIKLPLTLAIVDGLLVRIGGDMFVIPLSMVEECIEFRREDVRQGNGRNLINVRDEIVPYILLREQFDIEGNPPVIEQIVITRNDNQRIGFVVDQVIGDHQTVIKSLGRVYRNVKGLSGATILGNGTVALILDISQLVQFAEQQEQLFH